MIDKQDVISIVRERGPVIPRDVVKEIGGDTFLIGALLSQLVDKQEIKISHTKIGGSPVYYYKGQEEKLQDLYKYLKEMEKKAFNKIKEEKLLRDNTTEPAIRVALRNIKDFAKALEVNIKGRREIFWKWYLFSNTEAEEKIRRVLKSELSKPPLEPQKTPESKEEESEETKEVQKTIEELKPEPQKKPAKIETEEKIELLDKVNSVFNDKKIEIIEKEIIRKTSEIDMIIKIPSPVGDLNYFCKIRDKKKSNDKDLSSAYVQGQMKKLPVLYVTTGELTKKAEEMLDEEFKMISILNI